MNRLIYGSAFLLLAAGCSGPQPDAAADRKPAAAANASVAVTIVPVVSAKLHTTVRLPAQLIPYESVDIYPKVTGFVQTVTVDRGSRVSRGQVLVRLTAPELNSQRSQAAAAVRAAESQLATAKAKLASDNGTWMHMVAAAKTPGVIAENDVMIAEQTVSADKGLVEAAQQNVSGAHDTLRSVSQTEAYLTITAPFAGVVTTRNLHPGALIGPASGQGGSQPILQMIDDKHLRLVAPVPELVAGDVKLDEQVSFSVPAYPAQTFKAPIKRIAHAVDEKTRTMPVELDVINNDGKLTPGSYTTVLWPVERSYATMFVPPSAVTSDQQHTFVIRIQNNKAEWVTVQTGQTADGKVEVFGAIHAGDQVVKTATDAIHSGDAVTVLVSK
jgi:RND family efflux transporter MFP subunit